MIKITDFVPVRFENGDGRMIEDLQSPLICIWTEESRSDLAVDAFTIGHHQPTAYSYLYDSTLNKLSTIHAFRSGRTFRQVSDAKRDKILAEFAALTKE
jgi:hypothetical protein